MKIRADESVVLWPFVELVSLLTAIMLVRNPFKLPGNPNIVEERKQTPKCQNQFFDWPLEPPKVSQIP